MKTLKQLWKETNAKLTDEGIGYRLYELEIESVGYGLDLKIDGSYDVIDQAGYTQKGEYPKVIDELAIELYKVLA